MFFALTVTWDLKPGIWDFPRSGLVCPALPLLAQRLHVTIDVDFFQSIDAITHDVGGVFVIAAHRFEKRPEKRKGQDAQIDVAKRRFHFDFFSFRFA